MRALLKDKRGRCGYFDRGQAILEFLFCMIIVLLMMHALIMIFRWVGIGVAERAQKHEEVLTQGTRTRFYECIEWEDSESGGQTCVRYSTPADGPLKQLDPDFYTAVTFNAIWYGDVP